MSAPRVRTRGVDVAVHLSGDGWWHVNAARWLSAADVADWQESTPPAARPAEPPGELREALAVLLAHERAGKLSAWGLADALLSGPLAPLLADQATVKRVERAVASLYDIAKVIEHEVRDAEPSQYKANELGKAMGYRRSANDLRRALDGTQ